MLAAIITSTSFLAMHTAATSSVDARDKIQISFANKSTTRVLSLREKLSTARRENKIIFDYPQFVKTVADDLALCGSPISDVNLVIHVINGVGSEFRDIAAAVRVCDTMNIF